MPAVRKSCLMTFQSHWAQEVNNTLKLKYAVQWLRSYEQLMLLHGTGVRSQHPCNAAHSCLQLLLQGILPPLRTHAQCAYAQVFAHMHACAHTHAHTLKKILEYIAKKDTLSDSKIKAKSTAHKQTSLR